MAFQRTDETLARLLREFPSSPWAADARVMKMEIAAALGVRGKSAVDFRREAESIVSGKEYSTSPTPLDREDEIRLAAFQTLLSADARRASDALDAMLRADSSASEAFKQEALHALIRARLLTAARLEPSMPALRETLSRAFQNESNVKIRKEIIYTLANIYDEQAMTLLSEMYATESSQEIKKTIIDAFNNPTRNLLAYNPKFVPKVALIRKIEFEKLVEILRADADVELRRLAFYKLLRIGISKPARGQSPITAELIIGLYDAERDEELKISFIRFLKDLKQNPVTGKLLDIARNEKSDKLRLEAIYSLKARRDPEVLKFLEELIR